MASLFVCPDKSYPDGALYWASPLIIPIDREVLRRLLVGRGLLSSEVSAVWVLTRLNNQAHEMI